MNILTKHFAFIASILFLVSALAFMVWQQEQVVSVGTTIILETRPIDPRDLFRGEYVILRYAIETHPEVVAVAQAVPAGSPIYVWVAPISPEGVYDVVRVSSESRNVFDQNYVMLRGEVRSVFGDEREVRFPAIEQFYVPEGAGKPIEDIRDMLVEIAVRNGEMRVVQLLDSSFKPIDPKFFLP